MRQAKVLALNVLGSQKNRQKETYGCWIHLDEFYRFSFLIFFNVLLWEAFFVSVLLWHWAAKNVYRSAIERVTGIYMVAPFG